MRQGMWESLGNPLTTLISPAIDYLIGKSLEREKMKDSAKLLNFNVNRELKFAVFRPVDFNPRRELTFDLNRNLSFSTNRDLGFGKRGVVFRGYVCPICRAPVAKNALQCDECGVKFEQPVKKQPPIKKAAPKTEVPPEVKTSRATAPERRSTFECPGCSKILYIGTEECPQCMTRFTTAAPPPEKRGLPAQSAPPAGGHGAAVCTQCGYSIPPADRFCRRCGAPKPATADRTTVSWDEYSNRGNDVGTVTWDEYSQRKGG